jgi:PHD/YefM family antitoxin component YafN of YafNO toxin-antitoxin module
LAAAARHPRVNADKILTQATLAKEQGTLKKLPKHPMKSDALDISEVRRDFARLDQRLRTKRIIWVTRDSKKAFALVDSELMESVMETLEILNDPKALRLLERSFDDIQHGRLHDHEEIKKELLR